MTNWIPHDGGHCPGIKFPFETEWSDGEVVSYPTQWRANPDDLAWIRRDGQGLRIIAYRLTQEENQ